jgi:hypothetical protein
VSLLCGRGARPDGTSATSLRVPREGPAAAAPARHRAPSPGRSPQGPTATSGVQHGSRPVRPSSRSKGRASAGTGTSGPNTPIVRPVGASAANWSPTSRSRSPSGPAVSYGRPVARARSQPCTTRSPRTIAPTVRAGMDMAQVVPSTAPGAAHAATSRLVSSAKPSRQSPPSGSDCRLKSASRFAASAWKSSTTRYRCPARVRTSYVPQGVGRDSWSSSMARTTGTVRAAARSKWSLIFSLMPSNPGTASPYVLNKRATLLARRGSDQTRTPRVVEALRPARKRVVANAPGVARVPPHDRVIRPGSSGGAPFPPCQMSHGRNAKSDRAFLSPTGRPATGDHVP